jgi:hypothetical protein
MDAVELNPAASRRALVLALAVYFACYFLFWTLEALVFHERPHGDDIEQLVWASHPALGYSKHPPLPSLMLFVVEQVIPASVALVYCMGAACVAAAMLLAWNVGNATLGSARTRIGIFAIMCISFYTSRLHLYNNNTALLVANAASMLCVWRAVLTNRNFWWFALGVAWGGGMLSKYQMALPILCNVAFVAASSQTSLRSRTSGLSVAALVGTILFAPHAWWLFQHHFPTFAYASRELEADIPVAGRPNRIFRFLGDEAWRILPAVVMLRVLYAAGPKDQPLRAPTAADAGVHRFWLIHAWGPLLMMALLGAVGGVALQMHWGTAFLWAVPFWFLSTELGSQLTRLSLARALGGAAAVQAALMLVKVVWPRY